jgi:hypothetical protein
MFDWIEIMSCVKAPLLSGLRPLASGCEGYTLLLQVACVLLAQDLYDIQHSHCPRDAEKSSHWKQFVHSTKTVG